MVNDTTLVSCKKGLLKTINYVNIKKYVHVRFHID